MSDEPEAAPVDTAEAEAEEQLGLEGFEEALAAEAPHLLGEIGQPEQAEAVEASEEPEIPEEKEETPEAKKAEAPAEPEDKPEAEPTVNFDGLSDDTRTYWEKALKEGLATPDDVERARKESLFQSAWTKKTMALAEDRKAWEEQVKEREEDLKLLDELRTNDRLHDAWLKLRDGAVEVDHEDDDELVDKKTTRQLIREEAERLLAEKEAAKAREQDAYNEKANTLQAAFQEAMTTLEITPDQAKAYLDDEVKKLAPGEDIVLKFHPQDVLPKLELLHRAALAEAKAAELEKKLTQRATKDVRAAKQSLPKDRRVVRDEPLSVMEQTEADLGLPPDWDKKGLVHGFGHPPD